MAREESAVGVTFDSLTSYGWSMSYPFNTDFCAVTTSHLISIELSLQ